ncbi:hypothetical protein L0128_19330 [candidate division KSB1 bacterium]|nr:hypothetical protein [candidate division KSB1 bacterium]
MAEEISFEVEKGTNEYFTITLDEAIPYHDINRVLKTPDRWIRIQPRRYKGTTDSIYIEIVTRGLWDGFHRGVIRVNSENGDEEYVINLFVKPKKHHEEEYIY